MQRSFFAVGLCVALVASGASRAAQDCATTIGETQSTFAKAQAQLKTVSEAAERSRANVVSVYRTLDAAIASVSKARANGAEAELDRAIGTLATTKKVYDQAVAAERPQLIARIESERALRAARQALNDDAKRLHEQGQALVNVVERVQRGQVAPSTTDRLVCEQTDCVKVSDSEHAAMIAVGAVADTTAWPPSEPSCDFALLAGAKSQTALVRSLRAAQKDAQSKLKAAEDSLIAARQVLAAGIPAWDGAITATLDAHANPASNSHADELLGMAIEDLRKQSTTFNQLAAPYRSADDAVSAAKLAAGGAAAALNQHLDYWADLGRALISAAARAERGLPPRATASCAIGPSTQSGPWTFPLSPPPNC